MMVKGSVCMQVLQLTTVETRVEAPCRHSSTALGSLASPCTSSNRDLMLDPDCPTEVHSGSVQACTLDGDRTKALTRYLEETGLYYVSYDGGQCLGIAQLPSTTPSHCSIPWYATRKVRCTKEMECSPLATTTCDSKDSYASRH